MKEERINVLSDEVLKKADAICFTSNGVVKKNGKLTMGGGVAKSFADRFPTLPMEAGTKVTRDGNRVHQFWNSQIGLTIISFPTKNHWKHASDLHLIRQSARELMAHIEENEWTNVYLPFPGIGLGGLKKDEVKAAIKDILDERVTLCYL